MKKLFLYLGFGLAFNSAIGFVTSILEPSVPLGEHIAFAQCIGMTCIVIGLSLKHACRNRLNSVLVLLLSLPFSVAPGNGLPSASTATTADIFSSSGAAVDME